MHTDEGNPMTEEQMQALRKRLRDTIANWPDAVDVEVDEGAVIVTLTSGTFTLAVDPL